MYEDVFRSSTENPEGFWLKAAEGIDWDAAPRRALDSSGAPFYRWFPDGRLNVCFNALDRHVEAGRGEQPALVYDSPVTDTGFI
jgi:propionyl-CoA synthetase